MPFEALDQDSPVIPHIPYSFSQLEAAAGALGTLLLGAVARSLSWLVLAISGDGDHV